MIRFWRDEHTIVMALLAILLAIVYCYILTPLKVFETARLRTSDLFSDLTYRMKSPPAQVRDIVLVSMDDESLRSVGKKWPWGRKIFADLVDKLAGFKPRMICLDFTFLGESSADPTQDIQLARSFERTGKVLLASYIDKAGKYVLPLELFQKSAKATGLTNKPRDADFRIRNTRAVVFSPDYKVKDFSFGVKAAAVYFDLPIDKINFDGRNIIFKAQDSPRVLTEDFKIPVREDGTMPLNYTARYEDLAVVPVWKLIKDEASPEDFHDKVVVMGTTTEVAHDIHPTPFGLMPGIAVHANDLLMLTSGSFIYDLPPVVLFSILLVLALITTLTAFYLSIPKGLLSSFLLLACFSGLALVSNLNGVRLDSFGGLFTIVIAYVSTGFYRYVGLLVQSASLKKLAITDTLTGLFTHRYFRFRLQSELSSAIKSNYNLSLIIIGIDRFKELYDLYGFGLTNFILRGVTRVLSDSSKKADLLARYGTEEFCIAIPRADPAEALDRAEEIRREVEGYEFPGLTEPSRVTVSIGVASYPDVDARSSGDLIRCADVAMRRAMASGGNRVSGFDPDLDRVHLTKYERPTIAGAQPELEYIAMDLEERNRELDAALRELREAQREVEQAYFTTIQSLVKALEEKDPYTAGHSERVSKYSLLLAKKLGLGADDLELIRQAAPLHDVGKIGLPDSILHKKGQLSSEEISKIREHQAAGARILEPIKFFEKIIPLIRHHHERYDGKGYPHGLSGDLIPAGAQVIAIADSFDAMTTGRGYNRPLSVKEAVEELRKSKGSQFNPLYIEKFLEVLRSEEMGLAYPQGDA